MLSQRENLTFSRDLTQNSHKLIMAQIKVARLSQPMASFQFFVVGDKSVCVSLADEELGTNFNVCFKFKTKNYSNLNIRACVLVVLPPVGHLLAGARAAGGTKENV